MMRNDIWTVFVHSPISLPLCSYFVNCVKYCVCQCFIKELLTYLLTYLLNVPSGDQPTAQGLHRRMIPIFPCDSQRSQGVSSGTKDFLRLLVEDLGTSKRAQIFSYGKSIQMAISIQNATAQRVRSGPKMSENAQF